MKISEANHRTQSKWILYGLCSSPVHSSRCAVQLNIHPLTHFTFHINTTYAHTSPPYGCEMVENGEEENMANVNCINDAIIKRQCFTNCRSFLRTSRDEKNVGRMVFLFTMHARGCPGISNAKYNGKYRLYLDKYMLAYIYVTLCILDWMTRRLPSSMLTLHFMWLWFCYDFIDKFVSAVDPFGIMREIPAPPAEPNVIGNIVRRLPFSFRPFLACISVASNIGQIVIVIFQRTNAEKSNSNIIASIIAPNDWCL